jgi:hypothetical protein
MISPVRRLRTCLRSRAGSGKHTPLVDIKEVIASRFTACGPQRQSRNAKACPRLALCCIFVWLVHEGNVKARSANVA